MVGTPTEESWPGVSRLPNYRPHKLSYYRASALGRVWPRLQDLNFGEQLVSLMLQARAGRRVSADQALRHRYFSDLPASLLTLHPQQSLYTVPGLEFCQELDR